MEISWDDMRYEMRCDEIGWDGYPIRLSGIIIINKGWMGKSYSRGDF